jgi:trehalose 6-phosphate phosphatase
MTWTDPFSESRSRLASLSQTAQDWALFLDIDGTLLDIAESPELVCVPPTLIGDLRRVSASLQGALALVSGRAVKWIDHAFHPLELPVAGQQGAEIRLAAHGPVLTTAAANLDGIRARVRPLNGLEGIEIEDKGLSIAVHYRRAHERMAVAKALIAGAVSDLEPGIDVIPGRLVYEVKPRAVNKGTAIARLAQATPFAGRMPVYLGDDRTDEFGFHEVLARGGIAVQVGPSQAPPGCLWIENPSETRQWLAGLFPHTGIRLRMKDDKAREMTPWLGS